MIIFKILLIILISAPFIAVIFFLFYSAGQLSKKKNYQDEQRELAKQYGYRSQEFYERQTLELPKSYFNRDGSNRR